MANRIGKYYGGLDDIERASATLGFCVAMVRIQSNATHLKNWEIDSLSQLQCEAVRVFRERQVPLPWEGRPLC
jgi:hypothetical protein